MAVRKGKTYGRRKGNDLVDYFDRLALSPLPAKKAVPPSSKHHSVTPVTHDSDAISDHVINGRAVHSIFRTLNDQQKSVIDEPKSRNCGTHIVKATKDDEKPILKQDAHVEELHIVDCIAPKKRGRKKKVQCTEQEPMATHVANLPPEVGTLISLPFIKPKLAAFDSMYDAWIKHLAFTKVAQGSFASILRLALISDPETYTVWKLMPLKPRTGKGSRQDGAISYEDALAEVRLLEAMARTPGFVEFRSAQVLCGALPDGLRTANQEWRKMLTNEELVDLGDERQYADDQLWLFIEMTDAGTDLETWLKQKRSHDSDPKTKVKGNIMSINEAWDIFWGIVEALAHSEEHCEFEHRDLHPGNICLKKRPQDPDRERSLLDDRQPLIRRYTDLDVTLIDYTLSRASIQTPAETTQNNDPSETEKEVLANSMRDKCLFEQHSDVPRDEMQYDAYRYMLEIMHHNHKGAKRKYGWQSYMPMTNIVWLHHILVILLQETNLLNKKWTLVRKGPNEDEMETIMHLNEIRQAMRPENMWDWEFRSATELFSTELARQSDLSSSGSE